MIATTPCPCCGKLVEPAAELRWNEHARTLTGRGHTAILTPMQSKMFSKLWQAWPSGRLVSLDDMMDHVYADHEDGGPDNRNIISVQLNFMKKRIAPLGISIHGRHGYLIYEKRAAA